MLKREFPDELESNETPEEYIKNRVSDLNRKLGFSYTQLHPEFPALQKEKDIENINKLCEEIEGVLPEVRSLIKKIFQHIDSITEETKTAAAYILLGRAYSNLESALLLCRKGKNIEAMELSRSGKEALDLVMLFWDDKNKNSLDKWFKGKIIGNAEARDFQHEFFNQELGENFENKELPFKEMTSAGYKIMSSYTHAGYAGLLDSVDVYKLDFDFDGQAGYHYCNENFHVVQDLLIKILLQLKNSFLQLKDEEGFRVADKAYKPFEQTMTKEQMEKVLARHKKTGV